MSEKKKKASRFIGKIKSELNPDQIIGEVVRFNVRPHGSNGLFKYSDILKHLEDNGLNKELAKELSPKGAFSRAAKKMEENRMIDPLPSKWKDGTTVYQFTKKFLEADKWEHEFETTMVLDNETGKITCKNKALAERAEKELAKCMEGRTTNDVTNLLCKLFDKESADLIPWGHSCYIVFKEHKDFLDKAEAFHIALSGQEMMRLPLAKTERAVVEVQEKSANYVEELAKQLEDSVDGWTINTRDDTIERKSSEIKELMLKVESWAWVLEDRSKSLKEKVNGCKEKLLAQIRRIAGEKAKAPAVEKGDARPKVFGHSVTALIRWMGINDWTYEEAMAVFKHFKIEVADSTMTSQLCAAKTGSRGEPAKVTEEQEEKLIAIAEKALKKEKV